MKSCTGVWANIIDDVTCGGWTTRTPANRRDVN